LESVDAPGPEHKPELALADRAAFRHAVRDGKSAQELEPESKAAEEVSALWDWIASHLGIRESRNRVIPSVASL
jgi:hypothetical protein